MSENSIVREFYVYLSMLQMWNGGEYKKLSACPSYEEVKVYLKAYNDLIDYMYIPEPRYQQTPKDIVEMCL